MNTHTHALLTGAAAIRAAAAVHAAPVSWTPATNTGGKADLIEGNVVVALSGGSASPTVIGGGPGGTTDYAFTAANFTSLGIHAFVGTGADAGDSPRNRVEDNVYDPDIITSTGDADYDTLVESVTDSYGTPSGIVTGTLTLNNLADGGNYTIQVFFNDQRDATDDRTMTYGDGQGNTVDVIGGDPAAGIQTGMYGQFAVGSFTASGTSQDLTMTAVGFGNVHFTAIVVTGPSGANIPPEFDEDPYVFEIVDAAPVDTLAGTISATDSDGPNPVEYTITDGNVGDAFALDINSGELTVAGTIDLNTQNAYTLTVQASDGEGSTVGTVWVDVVEIPAPPVTVAFASSVLDETQWDTNGYGDIGYMFSNTDDNDAAGNVKRGGAIYHDSETPTAGQTIMFSQLSASNGIWSTAYGGLTGPLNAELENPDGGIFRTGNFGTAALGTNDFRDSFSLTFDEAVPDGYRIGILVGAHEVQAASGDIDGTTGNLRDIPYQLKVDSVSATTTQTALDSPAAPEWMTISPDDPNNGVPRADWYFFDLTDIEAGSSVTISAARIYSTYSHKFNPVNGVVIASLVPAVPDPVITGVSRSGDILTIDFTGEPGVTDWKVMAGTDLQSFPDDKTPVSIPESSAGVYQAQIDVAGDPAAYFMRVEH